MLSEISQRKTITVWFHLYVESKKQNTQTKQKQSHRYKEQTGGHQKGGGREVGKIGKGDWSKGTNFQFYK